MEGAFYVKAAAFLGAALVMGIGSVGPAIGQGLIGMEACKNVGKFPESLGSTRQIMIIAMALVETLALYCLLVAFGLIAVGYYTAA